MTTILTEEQCKEYVYGVRIHKTRCSRKAWKDGYCKQHHSDSKKEREDKKHKAWAEEGRLLAENRDKQARKIEARNRIIEATKSIVLNTTLPPPNHDGFVFTLESDFMELMNAYLEYEKMT